MTLRYLEIKHLRCLSSAKIELSEGCNLITGANGSGKTTILEAIYLLGSGRSFRASELSLLIQNGHSEFFLLGKLEGDIPSTIGVRATQGHSEFRINGELPLNLAELVRYFPVQVIDPAVHRLLEDGPSRRRKYVDWGVFHVKHSFQDSWRRFNRALKQRNAALKIKSRFVNAWDDEILANGIVIDECRKQYLESLVPFIVQIGYRLLGQKLEIEYNQGWKANMELGDALQESKKRDFQRGVTCVGPHRADIVLKLDELVTKDRISRGQQKLLACVLILAQQVHRVSIGAPHASLLLDDPAAELDADNLDKLLELIAELPIQLIVTTLTGSGLDRLKNAKTFHVEHGTVKAMA